MSFSHDGTNDFLSGSFTSTYAQPITLAIWNKITAHPVAQHTSLNFGNNSGSVNDSLSLRTPAIDDSWQASSFDSGGTASSAGVASINVDGIWAAWVGVFTNNSLRDVYRHTVASTDTNSSARTVAGALQHIMVGQNLTGGTDFLGKSAEVAIWNIALSTQQISDYMSGLSASVIAPANLIGYWPLSASGATQLNEGVDSGGDLTVTSAVFDSDHPTIVTSFSVPTLHQVRSAIRFGS